MLTEIEKKQYARMAEQRFPIEEGDIKWFCDVCKAPIRNGEPAVLYSGGAAAHGFEHTCEDEILFQELTIKAMGISLD